MINKFFKDRSSIPLRLMIVLILATATAALVLTALSVDKNSKSTLRAYDSMAFNASQSAITYGENMLYTDPYYTGTTETPLSESAEYRLTITVAVTKVDEPNGVSYVSSTAKVYKNDGSNRLLAERIDGKTVTITSHQNALNLKPILWLDAQDTSTITGLNAEQFAWADKSGTRADARVSQGTAPNLVLNGFNGKPSLRFSNGTKLFSNVAHIITSDATVIVVMKPSADSGEGATFIKIGSSAEPANSAYPALNALARLGNTASIRSRLGSSDTISVRNTVNGVPAVFGLTYANEEPVQLHYNGIRHTGDRTEMDIIGDRIEIGGDNGSPDLVSADIAEIIVYDYRLSCHQLAALENSLRTKWAISTTPWLDTCPAVSFPSL
jgi:hypothetical protein